MKGIERHKAELADALETWKILAAQRQAQVALLGGSATLTLRGVFLVNGVVVVGLLTFIGNLSRGGSAAAAQIAGQARLSIGLFAAGMPAALLATGLAYLSRVAIMDADKPLKARMRSSRIWRLEGEFSSPSARSGAFATGAVLVITALAVERQGCCRANYSQAAARGRASPALLA